MTSESLPPTSLLSRTSLQIELLGKLQLSCDSQPIRLSARKDQALFAYLANTPEQSQRRSHLAYLLWPDSNDQRARESLKQALLRLRKTLPEGLLVTDRQTAVVMATRSVVDVTRIEDLAARSNHDSLLEALEQFHGLFLGGLEDVSSEYEAWRNVRYQALLDSLLQAATTALERAVGERSVDLAQTLTRHIARLDPLNENAIRFMISAYLANGRGREARRMFDEFRQHLWQELGVEPEAATLELFHDREGETAAIHSLADVSVPRVVVFPFEVGSDQASQRFFAEGLTDDITTDLACNRDLEVLPASVFSGLENDVVSALSACGASHVVTGSVRRYEGRLRVNTRLLSARDNQIIWAQRYDRTMEDVFDMQDAISSQIVLHLKKELVLDGIGNPDRGTRNVQAYEMFLKGRSLYLRGINSRSLLAAKALLDHAVALDPEFARAYAQLAICESCLAMSMIDKTGENLSEHVLAHGRIALRMHPDLALGHAAVGLAYYASGHYARAESSLRRSVELDRNLFEAQFFLARNHHLQGDHEAAMERFRMASALRPEDFRSSGLLGDSLKAGGFMDEALDEYREALRRIDTELSHHPDNADALAFGAPILAVLGRVEQARAWSNWALAIQPEDCLSRYNLARVDAILGHDDQALEHLYAAFEAPALVRKRLALWMRHDKDFEFIRKDERFQELLAHADSEHP